MRTERRERLLAPAELSAVRCLVLLRSNRAGRTPSSPRLRPPGSLPGVVWIKQGELLDYLRAQQFGGLSLARVHLVPAAEAPAEYFDDLEDDELPAAGMPTVADHDLPEMVELVPETYAGPVASSPRDNFCEDCERRIGGRPMPPISLDGSDFARSPGDVAMYVSERVAEWVRTRGLSNVVAVEM